jgi:single-stranded DNA-binding protein
VSEPQIKQIFKVYIVGKVAKDAKTYQTAKGPVSKFSVYISGGKNKETDEWLPSKFFNVTLWGSEGQHVKKGEYVEFYARWQQSAYKDKKTNEWKVTEEYVVNTNEDGKPAFNHAGGSPGPRQRSVSDEQVASGRAPVIQRKKFEEKDLEITDEDIPF